MATREPHADGLTPDDPGRAPWRRAWIGLALLITLFAIVVQVYWWQSAGALWRDEVNSVNMAGAASIAEMPPNLQYESFPIFYFLALRVWIHGNAGTPDEWIRLFGLLTSVGLLGSLWLSARIVSRDVPIVALTLFATHAVAVRYAASIRGYGMGVIFIVVTFALVWRAMERGTPGRWAAAGGLALLSVHTLYQNWIFLFAICVAAACASIVARRMRTAVIALGLGAVCGASVLPYMLTLRQAREWNGLAKVESGLLDYLREFSSTMLLGGIAMALAWSIAAGVCVVIAFRGTVPARSDAADPTLYSLLTLLFSSAGFLAFLEILSYQARPWYFVPWMGVAAVSLEPLILRRSRSSRPRLVLVLGALAVIGLSLRPIAGAVRTAHTNVEALAKAIGPRLSGGDLVVVYPWMCGISFGRYYTGAAPWSTMPPVEDHRWHRYDQLERALESPRDLDAFRARVRGVLANGGRVWLVTMMPFERTMGSTSGFERAEQLWRVAMRAEMGASGAHVFGPWRPNSGAAYFEDPWVEVWDGGAKQPRTAADAQTPPATPVPPE